jgi:hypothetical protein
MVLPPIESFVTGNSGWACVCAGLVNVAAASKIAKKSARATEEKSPNLLTGWKEFGDIPDFQKSCIPSAAFTQISIAPIFAPRHFQRLRKSTGYTDSNFRL